MTQPKKTLTLKNQPITERILERRKQYFAGIDQLTDAEIERVSDRWHRLANRYQKMVARILFVSLAAEQN